MTGAQFGEQGGGVDIDLLADYIDGCLTGTPDESTVAALIAGDPAWRDAYRDLSDGMTAVGDELARLVPEPMPADLAARLDALLTEPVPAEISDPGPIPADLAAPPAPHLTLARDPDAVDDGSPGVRERKTTRRERGTRPGSARRLRWATPIAIAAGAVAFVGFGLDYLAGRSDEKSANQSTFAESQGRAADSAAGGGGPAAAGPELQLLNSGLDYTSATLGDAPDMRALAAGSPSAVVKQQPNAPMAGSSEPLTRLRMASELQQCLDEIQQANAAGPIAVESVDFARFDGRPAVVVRFSAQNGVWAWASGPACGTTPAGADTILHVPVR